MLRHPDRLPTRIAASIAALVLALSVAAAAAPPPPAAVADPDITARELRLHAEYLASEELAGRATGSAGIRLAGDYIAGRFEALGLKPRGRGRSYFQTFDVVKGVKLGPRNRLRLAAAGDAIELEAARDFLPVPFSGDGRVRAGLVFVGYGISAPGLEYDDYAGVVVKGKVVIALRHTPDGDAHGKFADYAPILYKVMTARDQGAAGIILITGPATEEKEEIGQFPVEGAFANSGLPAVLVFRDRLLPLLGGEAALTRAQALMAHGQAQSRELDAQATLVTRVARETVQGRNVVGILPGSDPELRDECVVIGAHYDHLGMGGRFSLAPGVTAIHHGADDNASGVAGVLELAQYFVAHPEKVRRTLIFAAFSGEEIGLLGSAEFVRQPPVPLQRIAAMINLDMIGRSRDGKVLVLGNKTSPQWDVVLAGADQPFQIAREGDGSGFGGSDHQSFSAKGVPVLFFFTGVHEDYHRPTDTADKLNVTAQETIVRFVAEVTERVAALPQRPEYVNAPTETPSVGGFPVRLGTIPDYSANPDGVRLAGVSAGGPADRAGIQAGDVIVEFLGKSIRNVEEYSAVLRTARPDAPAPIVVLRAGQRVALTITPEGAR